jgi:hypothetical protein
VKILQATDTEDIKVPRNLGASGNVLQIDFVLYPVIPMKNAVRTKIVERAIAITSVAALADNIANPTGIYRRDVTGIRTPFTLGYAAFFASSEYERR